MWKLFKSRKALSPVVAAIILIAVTVAVSIAVAAWMGALTFTFMKTEELKTISHTWDSTGTINEYVDLTLKNTGTGALSITSVRVNDASNGTITTVTVNPGASTTLRVLASSFSLANNVFASGTKYEFAVLTATGNKYTYVATAP